MVDEQLLKLCWWPKKKILAPDSTKIVQNNAKLCIIMQNYLQLCKIMQNYEKLWKIMQNYAYYKKLCKICKVIQNNAK